MHDPRRRHRSRRLTMTLLAWLMLGGCPEVRDGAPAGRCVKAYEQCTLRTGVLGVCDTVTCPQDQTPPCLVCRSQH
jgi:hypothetical protein